MTIKRKNDGTKPKSNRKFYSETYDKVFFKEYVEYLSEQFGDQKRNFQKIIITQIYKK